MHDHTLKGRAYGRTACMDCGSTDINWSGHYKHRGPHSSRCHPCYLAYCRWKYQRRAAEGRQTPSEQTRRVSNRCCVLCGGILGYKRSKFCPECALEGRRANERERTRLRGLSNWTRKCLCGVTFTATHRGLYCSKTCPARQPKRVKQPKPIRVVAYRGCRDCDSPIVAIGNRMRCPDCARLRNISRITSLYWIAAANREIRKASAWRHQIVDYLRDRDGNNCGLCGKAMLFEVKTGPSGDKRGATIDHILPRSRGGADDLSNLQLAHWSCNNRKGNRGGPEQLRLVG